jgi:hypothetical protein
MAKIHRNDPCPCGSGKKYKHCCYLRNYRQAQPQKIKADFTLDDGSKTTIPIASMDSIPLHNASGLSSDIAPEQMMDLCLDEIYKILQQEKVGMMRDLVDQVIKEMDIVPTFTYRQFGERMTQDGRFENHLMQSCSLKGTDPIELMVEKLYSK